MNKFLVYVPGLFLGALSSLSVLSTASADPAPARTSAAVSQADLQTLASEIEALSRQVDALARVQGDLRSHLDSEVTATLKSAQEDWASTANRTMTESAARLTKNIANGLDERSRAYVDAQLKEQMPKAINEAVKSMMPQFEAAVRAAARQAAVEAINGQQFAADGGVGGKQPLVIAPPQPRSSQSPPSRSIGSPAAQSADDDRTVITAGDSRAPAPGLQTSYKVFASFRTTESRDLVKSKLAKQFPRMSEAGSEGVFTLYVGEYDTLGAADRARVAASRTSGAAMLIKDSDGQIYDGKQ